MWPIFKGEEVHMGAYGGHIRGRHIWALWGMVHQGEIHPYACRHWQHETVHLVWHAYLSAYPQHMGPHAGIYVFP